MKIEISIGEIIDKLTILEIKKSNISDLEKLANINKEFKYLHDIVFKKLKINQDDYNKLLEVNKELWEIEDNIRNKERIKEFDNNFIVLARKVYYTNDKRANLKKEINLKYNSNLIEEKSYAKY
jgi:hypothetical protein